MHYYTHGCPLVSVLLVLGFILLWFNALFPSLVREVRACVQRSRGTSSSATSGISHFLPRALCACLVGGYQAPVVVLTNGYTWRYNRFDTQGLMFGPLRSGASVQIIVHENLSEVCVDRRVPLLGVMWVLRIKFRPSDLAILASPWFPYFAIPNLTTSAP